MKRLPFEWPMRKQEPLLKNLISGLPHFKFEMGDLPDPELHFVNNISRLVDTGEIVINLSWRDDQRAWNTDDWVTENAAERDAAIALCERMQLASDNRRRGLQREISIGEAGEAGDR